jgi:transposase
MAKATKLTEKAVTYAQHEVQTASDVESLRKGLAILLPAQTGISQDQTAQLLGISVATVKRYQQALYQRAHGLGVPERQRGGRHNETLSLEAEDAYLADWKQRAREGQAVLVKQLRADWQRRAGKRIPLYTMYRILARHGWRKVAPDTKHPKGDPAAQEAFKKTSEPMWLPPYARTTNV